MRRIKKHQKRNCCECTKTGTVSLAKWRQDGHWSKGYCEEHKHLIKEYEYNDYESEAEAQIGQRYGIQL